MLSILWIIVKIILIILLSVLGILVAVLLGILFIPFCYGGKFSWMEKKANGVFKVSWLFHMVAFHMEVIDNQVITNVKIFGRKVRKGRKEKSFTDDQKKEIPSTGERDLQETILHSPKTEQKQEKEEKVVEEPKQVVKETANTRRHKKWKAKGADLRERGIHILKKIQVLWEKIKRGKIKWEEWLERLQDEKNQASLLLLKNEGVRIIKSIAPKKIGADLQVGTGEPASTGILLGMAACLMPIYEDSISLEPNFEKFILEGDIMFKGNLQLGTFVLTAFRVWNDKNLRSMIKKLIK